MTESLTVTVKGAVAATGLSKSTIYNLIAAQKLTATKVGRRTLVTTKSIRELLQVPA